ncbi:MAG: hypothetical protein ACR2KZ_10000, partial [Segetibacter sp.]
MDRLLTILSFFITSVASAQRIPHPSSSNFIKSGLGINGANFYQNNKMNFYDIKYLKLDLTVQPKSKYISGSCNYTVLVNQALD